MAMYETVIPKIQIHVLEILGESKFEDKESIVFYILYLLRQRDGY